MGSILLFLFGAALGGQLNRAIYRWAWNQRSFSPWSAPPPGASARTWWDCVPIVGWWFLRREAPIQGKLFWLRPMLLELVVGLGLPTLYLWETGGRLLPAPLQPPADHLLTTLQWTFLAHGILFALMWVATFIDIDEKTIPDFVTVPGTIVAFAFAFLLPQTLLPVMPPPPPAPAPILMSSPNPWPPVLDSVYGLWIGLACFLGWCYGLLPKTIYGRRGVRKAMTYLVASIQRHPLSKWIGLMAIVGSVVIAAAWQWTAGTLAWHAFLSSLIGMAFAGGLVWAIRIVSGYVLGVEAMGFGDVTLMAMIGAFLGWQAAMVTFFLAPFTSLAIAVTQYLITGRRDIPFGPFLCAAAAIVVIYWEIIWAGWGPYFRLGLVIPMIVLVAIALMGVLLAIIQVLKRLVGMTPS